MRGGKPCRPTTVIADREKNPAKQSVCTNEVAALCTMPCRPLCGLTFRFLIAILFKDFSESDPSCISARTQFCEFLNEEKKN